MAKPRWASDWTVGIRVAIERDAQAVLGHVRADLMAAIDREHSITAAAKAAGMSYRRAWTIIQEMNAAAGVPMIEAAVGGVKGGGARLTPQGRFALGVYRQLHENLHTSAAGVLQQIISPDEKSSPCVHLAAAISLQEAMGQLLAEYALRRPAVRVRAVYGASNELADHLLAGAGRFVHHGRGIGIESPAIRGQTRAPVAAGGGTERFGCDRPARFVGR